MLCFYRQQWKPKIANVLSSARWMVIAGRAYLFGSDGSAFDNRIQNILRSLIGNYFDSFKQFL